MISEELKKMIGSMPKLTREQAQKIVELVQKGVSPKIAEMQVLGTLPKNNLQTIIVKEEKSEVRGLEEKFELILDLLKENKEFQKRIEDKIGKQVIMYKEKGFTEDEAIKMAKAELLFDIGDMKGIDSSITSMKEITQEADDVSAASDFLSQL